MKNLMSALAISALLASPVFAEGEHQHDGDPNTQGKQGSMMMSHERMMPMMQEHKKSMERLMGQLKKEADQGKRDELIEAHMKEMQQCMMTLNQGEGDMASSSTEERMKMMEERMGMRQMMMGQMMDNMVEARKSRPKHIKK